MRNVLNRWRGALIVGMCMLSAAGSVRLRAQSLTPGTPGIAGARLVGVVLDPDGKSVANASVTVKSDAIGGVRTTMSDADGRFAIPALPAGVYVIEVTAPGFAAMRRAGLRLAADRPEDITINLSVAQVTEEINVSASLPAAAKGAPSQGSLTARSAQSVISDAFIRDDTSPIADYTQVIQMAPGTYSFSPNGVGLGDSKTFFRGFQDGYYTITFDGIPFNDTNTPSHHSWAFFPGQFIGGTVFDRSPGSAATVGPTTYGGSVNLLSRNLGSEPVIRASGSYGSFSTRLMDAEFDSGRFGPDGKSQLLMDVHEMKSDGYQTFNFQKRDAFSAKYQYALSDNTAVTAFTSVIDVHANTPNTKGPTRAQVAQFGNNYLLSGNAADANYYGYNFYHVPTDFEYVDVTSNLGNGWSIDDKVYTYKYYNQQNFNGTTAISATSGTDKLNSYRKVGNLMPVSHASRLGIFRTGLWSEYAWTDRFQTPSDPRTWVDAALPNFHEKFNTTTLQPYAEYEVNLTRQLRVTPGVKLAYYKQDFTQFADNGKTVGSLSGAASVNHVAEYHSWLPSLDAHYLLRQNWSAYVQYGKGQNIPPSSVFDVKNAQVSVLPRPTLTSTYQAGSVWKSGRLTLDVDAFRIHFENDYSSAPDPATGEPVYYLAGSAVTKGVEAESNILVGGGFSMYLNATAGSAKYVNTGLWVQNAPQNTETLGLNFQQRSWSVGLFSKRVGKMYNDNGATNQAVAIDPFNITNLFVNYALKGASRFAQTKIKLAVNNLFNDQNIVGVNPASTKTSVPAPGDVLNIMAARSVSLTFTIGVSAARP